MLEILESLSRCPSTSLGAVVSPSNDRRIDQQFEALERFRAVMDLEHLAKVIQDTSLCGLGQSAPNPVLSTLRWFRDEYEARLRPDVRSQGLPRAAHLRDRHDALQRLRHLRQAVPSEAIVGAPKSPHHIIPERCVACGSCVDVCNLDAVLVH